MTEYKKDSVPTARLTPIYAIFVRFVRITTIADNDIIVPIGITIFFNKTTISFLLLLPEINTHATQAINRIITDGKSIKFKK